LKLKLLPAQRRFLVVSCTAPGHDISPDAEKHSVGAEAKAVESVLKELAGQNLKNHRQTDLHVALAEGPDVVEP